MGTVDEAHGHVEPPLHAAGVGLDERVGLVGQPEGLEQVGCPPVEVGAAHALQAALEDEVLAPGRVAVDARCLRDVADRPPHRAGLGADVVSRDGRPTGIALRQGREDAHGRRLAGAVRPEQAEDLALGDGEPDPVEGANSFP